MFEFTKASRLLKRPDFDRVMEQGERWATSRLVVVVRDNVTRPRLGLVVSKKFGDAVRRNQLKRQLRESFRLSANECAPVDVVVIARPAAKGGDHKKLRSEFEFCLAKAIAKLNSKQRNTTAHITPSQVREGVR